MLDDNGEMSGWAGLAIGIALVLVITIMASFVDTRRIDTLELEVQQLRQRLTTLEKLADRMEGVTREEVQEAQEAHIVHPVKQVSAFVTLIKRRVNKRQPQPVVVTAPLTPISSSESQIVTECVKVKESLTVATNQLERQRIEVEVLSEKVSMTEATVTEQREVINNLYKTVELKDQEKALLQTQLQTTTNERDTLTERNVKLEKKQKGLKKLGIIIGVAGGVMGRILF